MRGSIRRRSGIAWTVSVSAGFDPVTGQRRRIVRTVRGTKEDAERELTKILREVDLGLIADPGRLMLAAYLRDRWLPHQATRVRARTLERYRQLLEGHVIPSIGHVPMAKLRPVHVQQVIDAMLTKGRAPRTVASAYRVLHGALAQAVRWQLLAVNPALAVRPPRPDRPTLQVPSSASVARILGAVRGTRLYVPLALIASTGMRRGEALALKWSDVDLESGRIRVTSSLQDVAGELVFLAPKTDRSRRTIELPASATALLRRHRKDQAERRLLAGPAWRSLDLVIDQGDGGPYSPDALTRAYYRLVRSLGFTGGRIHDLRHAFATELLGAGVHPKVVSEALGHSSVGFTMDTYQHLMPSMQEAAARAIEQALGAAIRSD